MKKQEVLKKIGKKHWKELKSAFKDLMPLFSSAVLVTVAAVAVGPSNGMTFADAITISEALKELNKFTADHPDTPGLDALRALLSASS